MNYFIIKIKIDDFSLLGNSEALKDRASGWWHTTFKTLLSARKALLLVNGNIVREYSVGDEFRLRRSVNSKGKVVGKAWLDLTEVQDSKLVGRILKYPTANPFSVLSTDDMIFR